MWQIKYCPDGVREWDIPIDDSTRDFVEGAVEYVGGEWPTALADILRGLIAVYEEASLDILVKSKLDSIKPSQKPPDLTDL